MLPVRFAGAATCPQIKPGDPPPDAIGGKVCNPGSGFFLDFDITGGGKYTNTFAGAFLFLVNAGLALIATLAVAYLVYGGYQYVTSRGEEEQATAGKRTIANAIIGLIIAILSYVIVTVIFNALSKSRI